MKKLPICILSLLVASSTALIGGCHTGQTDSGQSIKNEPKDIVINDNILPNDDDSPEIPDDILPDMPNIMPEIPDDDTLPPLPEDEMPAPDDLPKPPECRKRHHRHSGHGAKFDKYNKDMHHHRPHHKKPPEDDTEPQEPLPDDENPSTLPENGKN
jgi:hypothetical protein